jgi:hypothetical protein
MDGSSVALIGTAPAGMTEALPDAITVAAFADDDSWVARTALAISAEVSARRLAPPVLLVIVGALARHAPALGFAQRAARRSVRGYVLVDPHLPRAGQVSDWPDAPVSVVLSTPDADAVARDARLRGWEVFTGDAAQLVAELASDP